MTYLSVEVFLKFPGRRSKKCYALTKYSGTALTIILKVLPRLKLKRYKWSFGKKGTYSVNINLQFMLLYLLELY